MQHMQNKQIMQNMQNIQYPHSISRTCLAKEFGLVILPNYVNFPPPIFLTKFKFHLSEPTLSPICSFLSASWLSHDSRLRAVCRVLWSMCLTWRAMSLLSNLGHCPCKGSIQYPGNLFFFLSGWWQSDSRGKPWFFLPHHCITSQPGSLPCKRSDWFRIQTAFPSRFPCCVL